jgi:hypothetical protein
MPIKTCLLLFLVFPGSLAAGSLTCSGEKPGKSILFSRILAATYVLGIVGAEIFAAMGSMFVARYAIFMLVTLPLLMLSGAVALVRPFLERPWKDAGLQWWPVTGIIMLWLVVGTGHLSFSEVGEKLGALARERDGSDVKSVVLLGRMHDSIEILDLSGSVVLPDLIPNGHIIPGRFFGAGRIVRLRPASCWRRFVLQPCLFSQDGSRGQWVSVEPGRIVHFGRCVDEDRRPKEILVLKRRAANI